MITRNKTPKEMETMKAFLHFLDTSNLMVVECYKKVI